MKLWLAHSLQQSTKNSINTPIYGVVTPDARASSKVVRLFDKNPRTTNITDPSILVEKTTIRDLPLSVDNAEINKYLKSLEHINLTSDIRYSKERNEAGKLTNYRDGGRYIYAKAPINPALLYSVQIAGQKCCIFHKSQAETCKICGEIGHHARCEQCQACSQDMDILPFKSYTHPPSNHYMSRIVFEGEQLPSNEHVYL